MKFNYVKWNSNMVLVFTFMHGIYNILYRAADSVHIAFAHFCNM